MHPSRLALVLLVTGCGWALDEASANSSYCARYAANIQRLVDSQGCAGAGKSAAALEAACNAAIEQQVKPRGCLPQYEAYLECASRAQSCNPCSSQYSVFTKCACAGGTC